jgi:PAS domain S-box-containing protein
MAGSPDYLRLATSAVRSLVDTAFDSGREAVLVVDARPKHLPLVLANAAARGCLTAETDPAALLDASLFGLLAPATASAIEDLLASLTESRATAGRVLIWRLERGETAVMTEVKLLAAAQGRRLIMMTFAASAVESDLASALDQLPFDFHPIDRTPVNRAIENAFLHCRDVQQEFRLKANDGRYRSFATIARPLFDAAGAPQGLVRVTQDVTARREAEAQLRRSEELLRVTTANTADTLMLADTDLRIRFINRSMGGLAVDQIVGSEITAVLPEHAHGMVIGKLREVLHTGETATYEFESTIGSQMQYFENRAVLVRDEGLGMGISISVRNVTERKRLEQEILKVSCRERQTIGRDLHDGLGQELTGVALMLRGLATRVQRQAPDAVSYVNEIVSLVNQSIETARSLARGLLPVRTDSGGLPFALRTLADRSRDLYGLEVNFFSEIWPQITLSESSASHLYRIAQEALTNAARHGHASTVEIFLLVARNTFLLRITDDGAGIGSPVAPVNGMGLKIMGYRAGMIGAKFEIGPNVPQGTVVCVTGEQPAPAGPLHSAHAI